jgi:hypothetical protein
VSGRRPGNYPLTMLRHRIGAGLENWAARHNEVAMLLFAMITPWMLFNIFTSAFAPF